MEERVAIVAGVRTPQCLAGGPGHELTAEALAARVLREVLARSELPATVVDEVLLGNLAQPLGAVNVARVAALLAGLPEPVPACTVQGAGAGGALALLLAATRLRASEAGVILAGGAESCSHLPLLLPKPMADLLARLRRARTLGQRLRVLSAVRPAWVRPVSGTTLALTDPVGGLHLHLAAEWLVREFHLSRADQDALALRSHQRAAAAAKAGRLAVELVPVSLPPAHATIQAEDQAVQAGLTLDHLARLPAVSDAQHGTITTGNAAPLADGACALLLMRASRARELQLTPLGYLRAAASVGVAPQRMGLAPVHATARLLRQANLALRDFDLVELDESYAAVTLACQRACASAAFAREHLDLDHALGELADERLNVNGGAIALGHPLAATGARMVLTLLHELRRRNRQLGLVALGAGGGLGVALAIEVA
jgi:acetyl-CoA acetyltransferase family protein